MLAVRLLEHPEGRQGHQIHRQAGCHPEGDITLYAQWKRDPACKADLVYDKNSPDATGETAGHTGWKGDQATIAANGFTNEGYTFQGWNTQPTARA